MEVPSPGLSPVFGAEGEGYPGGGGSIEWFGEDRGPGGYEEGFSPNNNNNNNEDRRSSLKPRRLMFDDLVDNERDNDGSPILRPRVLFMTPSRSSSSSSLSSPSEAQDPEQRNDEIFRSPARWFDLPSLTATDERERNAIFGSAGVYSFPADNMRLVTPPTMTPDQALAAGHVTRYPMTLNDADNAGDRAFNDRYWTYVGNRIQRSIDAGLDVQDRIPVNTLYVEDEDEDDFLMLPVLAIHMSSTQVEERVPGLAQKTDLRRPFRAFFRFFGSNTVMAGLRASPETLRIPVGPRHWLSLSLSGNSYSLTAIPEAVSQELMTREKTETALFTIEEKPMPETEFVSLWNPRRTIGTDFPDSYPLNCERGMIVVITQDTASDFNDPGRIMMLIKPIPSLMNQ